MIANTAKVMPILSSVLVLIGFFLTSCVGISLEDIPQGLHHPQLIPAHEVRKTPLSMSTDESIGITFAALAIIPWGGHSYTKTPHGMFCLYGK